MDLVPPLVISVHSTRGRMNLDEVCGSAVECAAAQAISDFWLLVVTGLLTFVVLAAAFHVREARSSVSEERTRTLDEQTAFAEFSRRVARLDAPDVVTAAPAAAGVFAVSHQPPPRQLQQVVDAYRATVMAVPHYDEEYGETLAEHMAAELGEALASAIASGVEFSPPLKGALVRQSADAQQSRVRFVDRLDREEAALDEAETVLTEVTAALDEMTERPIVAHRFEELLGEWERLGTLERRCGDLTRERQRQMAREPTDGGRLPDAFALHDYLYWSLPVAHPVLADAANLLDRLGEARREIALALTTRA